ncbi:hypothetical protein COCSUDRAFT_53090 [Coccomyxa subellipsoidea C-169]|uniref:Uncharacterized protein n=1 Tax=Coccomyxa subellipsoidea (strain C-169) TaxID=574566 RepID=I0Z2G2_COCSC|nr:hypothetical protein COCSUDRAFT_53090 [Coccomyxa subellipsoidea C-169]EIE24831.1 hypothetical protein COCSUDRAFT_53090 [Coccomyxa subellipsoidea C-169]|eukprot:XP_005649375.1 hypothetical protein COCSUDRAFT_53090 [Coccomyxa subellipsoidea C-169]
MASSSIYVILAASLLCACVGAAPTGKMITAADIPATPAAATCKAILDGAAVQFAAGGIAAVTQVAGATISNYLFCMEYKPTAKDTAMIVTHIEPTYLKVPFSTLTTSPATPQVAGFVNAVYMVGAATTANGDYGLATYPWDLANKANAAPANQKTSLVERFSTPAASYLCGCGIATAPTSSRRMLH